MDKFSKFLFSMILATLLVYSAWLYLEAEAELCAAETKLAELRSQAERLREENERLLESAGDPFPSAPRGMKRDVCR